MWVMAVDSTVGRNSPIAYCAVSQLGVVLMLALSRLVVAECARGLFRPTLLGLMHYCSHIQGAPHALIKFIPDHCAAG
jgi:hypothetical protein